MRLGLLLPLWSVAKKRLGEGGLVLVEGEALPPLAEAYALPPGRFAPGEELAELTGVFADVGAWDADLSFLEALSLPVHGGGEKASLFNRPPALVLDAEAFKRAAEEEGLSLEPLSPSHAIREERRLRVFVGTAEALGEFELEEREGGILLALARGDEAALSALGFPMKELRKRWTLLFLERS